MKGAQKILMWAFLVLSVVCVCATGWMISVLGFDAMSCLMLVMFVLAAIWAGVQIKQSRK
ncbi:MAG: hypothetical protein MJZ73_08240 [Bacteroidaceae bacterium]|nr:hypothetical protein [Bacteroidaceae bacterium]